MIWYYVGLGKDDTNWEKIGELMNEVPVKKTNESVVTRFLTFCDKQNLSFRINFRPQSHDSKSRFYLSFSPYAELKILRKGAGQIETYHFSNGRTPQEALENAANELYGNWLQFKACKYDKHEVCNSIFE